MNIELGEHEVLEDMMIDGLKIVQDTRLYRFTSDSVLLSRFARAKKRDKVADPHPSGWSWYPEADPT